MIDVNSCFGFLPHKRADVSLDRLLKLMEMRGITKALTLSTRGIFGDCGEGNRHTAAMCRQDTRLVPVGTLDPRKLMNPQTEIERCRQEGIHLFRFFPDIQRWPLESVLFDSTLQTLASQKAPVMISATQPGTISRLRSRIAGYPGPVVLQSVGMEAFAETLWAIRDLPHVCIDTRCLSAPDAIANACSVLGASRVLFGSGAPESTLAGAMLAVYRSPLSEEDRNAVLGGNAQRLLEAG